ncbi:CLC_0170 family protein [Cohnella massiliensis]|uniref:CLC_0170 family protein n=1 Tax=Cohnella massiliensis TaxID=1816691 RepID=UPI0009BA2F8A|nr:CLC_0170 family protein [Cohnella massiliensis]
MLGGGYMSSIGYMIGLSILTGALILLMDVRTFRNEKREKEKKTASVLGWFNVTLGCLLYIANSVFKMW